jgi:hypothetical protein
VAGGGDRNAWEGGVNVDGGGGKLVVDRRSLGGGGGTPVIGVQAFNTWTIGSPYGSVTGVKVKLGPAPASLQSSAVRESPEDSQWHATYVAVTCTADCTRVFSSA